MNKNKFLTIIDYGSSMIRIGVFNNNLNNFYVSSKEIDKKNNSEEKYKIVSSLVKEAEKKISNYLDNIIVLYDSPEIYSIDLSIRKDFDQPIIIKDIYSSIILEANQLINNNYINSKIIHVISLKNIIDGKEFDKKFNKNLKARSIIVEIKFICLPIEKYNKVINVFRKNNLELSNLYCSSYVKSLSYIESLKNHKLVSFLDIGFERSTLLLFNYNKLIFIKTIAIGGNHITKDISNVLKLNIDVSENIKKALNKTENEFSYDKNINENNDLIKEIMENNISIDILKKVVLARIEEIFELIFKEANILENFNVRSNCLLVLTGNGSKLFDKNSFHLDDKYSFKDLSFYEENDSEICKSGLKFDINLNHKEVEIVKKNQRKTGIFEKFFNFFAR